MLPASLRPLRNRDFALLWSANLVSNIGSWMQTIGVGALVVSLTGKAVWAGLAAAAAFLPLGLLSPVGGALADRLDRRRFILAATGVEAVLASGLAMLVFSGGATPTRVSALLFVEGSVAALRLPFQQAIIPDLVPREELLGAASLGAAGFNMGRVVGPSLAAGVIAVGSYGLAFALNALSFFAVILALVFVRVRSKGDAAGAEGVLERIRAGAREARREPGCRTAIGLIAVVALLASPFISLIPAKARLLVEAGAGGGDRAVATVTGLLTTAQGVGAVLGALVLPSLAERFGRLPMLLGALSVTPVALVLYAGAPTVVLAVAALGLVGFAYIGILSGLNTVVQLRAPAEFRGRVLSLYLVALGTIYPLGALVQGALGDRFGLPQVTAASAATLLALLGVLAVTRRRLVENLGEVPAPVAAPAPAPAPGDQQGQHVAAPT